MATKWRRVTVGRKRNGSSFRVGQEVRLCGGDGPEHYNRGTVVAVLAGEPRRVKVAWRGGGTNTKPESDLVAHRKANGRKRNGGRLPPLRSWHREKGLDVLGHPAYSYAGYEIVPVRTGAGKFAGYQLSHQAERYSEPHWIGLNGTPHRFDAFNTVEVIYTASEALDAARKHWKKYGTK